MSTAREIITESQARHVRADSGLRNGHPYEQCRCGERFDRETFVAAERALQEHQADAVLAALAADGIVLCRETPPDEGFVGLWERVFVPVSEHTNEGKDTK